MTPLTEACGLIEWVQHTTGLRNCCQSVYVAGGKFDRGTNAAIKQMYDSFQVGFHCWLFSSADNIGDPLAFCLNSRLLLPPYMFAAMRHVTDAF